MNLNDLIYLTPVDGSGPNLTALSIAVVRVPVMYLPEEQTHLVCMPLRANAEKP